MNLKKTTAGFLFGAFALVAPVAVAQADTIVDIAVSDPSNFSSLVDAVVSQDLADTLSSEGPFTVFAPTNDAFEKLPGFLGRALAEKPELLTDILLYHVVADDLDSGEVLGKKRITTVEGSRIFPTLKDGTPYINSSEIVSTDIVAENGTIHVIDKVLVPRSVIVEAFRVELDRLRGEFRTLLNELRHYQ